MADGCHLGFRFWHIISASINVFCAKFCPLVDNRQPKGTHWSEIWFTQIEDGGRPPYWISILVRNLGVDQHYCAKFGTVMENRWWQSAIAKVRYRKSRFCHVGLMYKLLYPSIRVRTAPPISVRVRTRVSVSFSFTVLHVSGGLLR